MFSSLYAVAAEVGGYWQTRAYGWLTSKNPRDTLLDALDAAETYEEWEAVALQLDEVLGYDLWRQNGASKDYDYRLIYERQQAVIEAREEEDVLALVGLLRSGLVRSLGNITAPRLYDRAYAGTKLLIEDYITQVALAIEHVTTLPATQSYASGWTAQTKLDLLHDTRQAFGRSSLVLQGGAIFGLCHLGVVKALHLRGLLPRIITGTATGALIAALVSNQTEDELLDFLSGDGIDLEAFGRSRVGLKETQDTSPVAQPSILSSPTALFNAITARTISYMKDGYLLDVKVLEACVQANLGDTTFLEAYARTKRVLNITIATTGRSGIPNLLNYLTAPNVLIHSATIASGAVNVSESAPITLKYKDEDGNIVSWSDQPASVPATTAGASAAANASKRDHDAPLARIASLFNVNHFIVSQARPYIAPFLLPTEQHQPPHPRASTPRFLAPILRLITGEVHHRLTQLDEFGVLPPALRKVLLDEAVPSSGSSITLVPSIGPSDYLRLLERPGRAEVEHWIRRGERSVWPAVSALRIRCAVEVELDRGYQTVRRRKPLDGDFGVAKVEGRS